MDAELVDTGLIRDSRGRRIESAQERERLLAAYDDSGLTQKAFAAREGIAYSTFVSWLKKRRRKLQEPANTPETLFHEVTMPTASPPLIEVCFPDGMVLRGRSAEALASLVKALRC